MSVADNYPVKPCPLCGQLRPLQIVYKPRDIHQCRCGMMYRNIDYIPENRSGQMFSHGTSRRSMFTRRINLAEDMLPPGPIESVLIVGCGMGLEMKEWLPVAKRVEGIDLCEIAIERAKEQGLAADLCSLEDAAKHYGKYTVVVCGDVLEHVYDLHAAIDSLAALVDENGVVIIDVPETDNPFVDISDFYTTEHLWHFTLRTLPRMMGNHGFGVLEIRHNQNNLVGAFGLVDGYEAVFEEYQELRQQELAGCSEWLDTLPKPYAAWGASEHFQQMYDGIPSFRPGLVVDSSQEALMRLKNTIPSIDIGRPEDLEEQGYPAVVICSRMFRDEIKQQLKELKFKGRVFCPADKPWL